MKTPIALMCILVVLAVSCSVFPSTPVSRSSTSTVAGFTNPSSTAMMVTQANAQTPLETIVPPKAPNSTREVSKGWRSSKNLVEFNDMAIVSDEEVWAVGQNGFIIHGIPRVAHLSADFEYSGEYRFNGRGGYLNSIDFVSKDDGWMTGWGAQLLHWNGTKWVEIFPFDVAYEYFISEVDMVDNNDGWLVGGRPDDGEAVLKHFNGSEWLDVPLQSQIGIGDINLTAIHAISKESVIATGYVHSRDYDKDGIVLFWNGMRWEEIPNEGGLPQFSDVSGLSRNNIWAMDWRYIYHWNGEFWKKIKYAYVAVGEGKNGTILALPDDDVWIAGYDLLARWDGHTFQDMRPENQLVWVVDLEISDSGTLYALTRQGEIFKFFE